MGLISFGSLKGGVGKTSLSVNVAHAFAERGCETLLLDLDPMGHASRFFASRLVGATKNPNIDQVRIESTLARILLTSSPDSTGEDLADQGVNGSERSEKRSQQTSLIHSVRPQLSLIPAGPELRHFLWGRGARTFKNLFARLIDELRSNFDYVVIDTPPDFNVLTRNAIAVADLVVVPVDSSAMSIIGLEEIVSSASHIKGPTWTIIRSMVNRQASRIQRLSADRLQRNLALKSSNEMDDEDDALADMDVPDMSNPEVFISMLEEREQKSRNGSGHYGNGTNGKAPDKRNALESTRNENPASAESPLYLLNSVVYRSEEQNRLTFSGKTVFDVKSSGALKEQYTAVARELEQMLSFRESSDPTMQDSDFSGLGASLF